MKIIWHWLILSIALYLTARIMPRAIQFHPMYVALVVGACLYFVNATIKPLMGFFTMVANIFTLGIFSIILNGGVLWLMQYVVTGFYLSNFKNAIIAALVISVLNWILETIL